ncbi:MAG: gliding motility-associated transporter permease protein [Planctomycetaceae bacterium]|nr:gliding motility-associated transporter permease protein [Planctomycetaceae bacterium]
MPLKQRSWNWSLPLLEKELIEQATRSRTYLVRSLYAGVLLVVCFSVLQNSIPHQVTLLNVLGVGRIVFGVLVKLQEFGLYLALPILACGTLTVERERKTLDLLLVTRLTPGTIVVEKFFSRLLPALNLLLLSAPMLAFSYSLGGLTLDSIMLPFCGLILTAIRLTAVSVACSAGFRTTAQALVASYLGLLLLYCTDRIVVASFFPQISVIGAGAGESWVRQLLERRTMYDLLIAGSGDPAFAGLSITWRALIVAMPSLSFSILALCVARWLLIVVSFGVNNRVQWFRNLFERRRESQIERRQRSGQRDEPEFDPISWRESPRRSEQAGWWIRRLAFLLVGVTIVMLVMTSSLKSGWPADDVAVGTFLVWIVVTIWLIIKASGVIVQERTRQTLEVLATTPLTAQEILQQKMVNVNRCMLLTQIALAECVLWHMAYAPSPGYFFASAFLIGLYPPIIAWQGVVCGINAQNGAWAILKTVLMLTARCLAPWLIVFLFSIQPTPGGWAFVSTGPTTFLIVTEVAMQRHWEQNMFVVPVTSVVVAIVLLVYLRSRATRLLETSLGRQKSLEVKSTA